MKLLEADDHFTYNGKDVVTFCEGERNGKPLQERHSCRWDKVTENVVLEEEVRIVWHINGVSDVTRLKPSGYVFADVGKQKKEILNLFFIILSNLGTAHFTLKIILAIV